VLKLSGLFFSLILFINAFAAGNEAVIGVWTVQSGDARVEISATDAGVLNGQIIWLREPNYPAGDAEEGKPKRDRNNPDVSKQNDPLLGLKLLKSFTLAEENLWKGGKIYDPKNGKEYSCKMTLVDHNTLEVRGFIGISLLGRTDVWKRYSEESK
jgi:uncharacterized protein (DUF2147 family)